MKRIDIRVIDPSAFTIGTDEQGKYLDVEGHRLRLMPHASARALGPNEVLSVVLEHLDAVVVSVVSSYLYDLIRNRKARSVKVDGGEPATERDEIEQKLKS